MSVRQIVAGVFMALIAAACYTHPVADDFDRYMYEAIVRSKFESLQGYYPEIRHESKRAEESSVIDTPEHMKEAESLYAVRPLYIELISLLSRTGLSIQHAINAISAVSLFCIGLIVLAWTRSSLLPVLLVASGQVLSLGRLGTPDALAALLIIAAFWMLEMHEVWALGLLFVALFVRTDSLLVLLAVIVWLAVRGKLRLPVAGSAALGAVLIVLGINHWTGHPGWVVLFRLSFIGGKVPSQVPHTLSVAEYLAAFVRGAWSLSGQIALWILLGVAAWRCRRDPLLIIAAAAAVAHFALYPSPEVRYMLWGCLLVGVLFIRCVTGGYWEARRTA